MKTVPGKDYKTTSGKVKSKIALKMKGSLFGAVTCDKSGNLYVVSGKDNSGTDTSQKTVFITKYTSNGKLMKSIGNNGSSSLASYYDSSFYTKQPFEGGTCDVAINGNYLAVTYGRKMYSGHQSNSVWIINCNMMSTVNLSGLGYKFYQSHSFGQRVKPYKGGFVFMSEGDCFDRAFVAHTLPSLINDSTIRSLYGVVAHTLLLLINGPVPLQGRKIRTVRKVGRAAFPYKRFNCPCPG